MPRQQPRVNKPRNSRARARKATDDTMQSDNGLADALPATATTTSTTDLLRRLSSSVGKAEKDGRQKLESRHKTNVKNAEEKLRETSRLNKQKTAEYRRTQLNKLSDLVKQKTEIENEILSQLQSVQDRYESVSRQVKATLTSKLSTLR